MDMMPVRLAAPVASKSLSSLVSKATKRQQKIVLKYAAKKAINKQNKLMRP